MRIGPFGVWEIMIILIVVLLVFGPRRLPEMAKGLGQSVRAFRKEMRGLKDDIDGTEAVAAGTAPAGSAAAPVGDAGARAPAVAAAGTDASAPEDGGERTSS